MKKAVKWLSMLLSCMMLGGCSISGLLDLIGNGSSAESSSSDDSTLDGKLPLDASCSHADANMDAYCDVCKGNLWVTIDFYAVNDLHGKVTDLYGQTGVGGLTTYLKGKQETDDHTVFLSSGDMWQGTSESYFTRGMLVNDWMEELGFVSMTLGNHEFDWGTEYIAENAEQSEVPFLAINIYDNTTNLPVEYCQPSVMVERGGAKIGIIGAIGDCYSSISSDKVEDVYFKVGDELTDLVKAESTKLRAAGADCIIYSMHDDDTIYNETLSAGYVDLVFEGHTHQGYVKKDSNGVYHLQGGGENRGITHAELAVNVLSDSIAVKTAERISNDQYASLPADSLMDDLLDKYSDAIDSAFRLLGKNDIVRSSTELCNLAAQLYLQTGLECWGEQYDIVLGGGFFQARSPYDLKSGEIRYSDVQSIFPFDNPLVLCSIPGYYLRTQFLETTNSNYYIACSDYGSDIRSSIKDSATYYIVVDTYTALYKYNHATEIARYNDTTFTRDLIAGYIEDGGMTVETDNVTYTSIPEIYEIGNRLSNNQQTGEKYYVKGTVVSIEEDFYGNLTIRDENGNTLYVYGVWDQSGNRYGYMPVAAQPKVGDEVVFYSAVKKFVYAGSTTIELINATILS